MHYTCEYCSKTFTRKHNMLAHQKKAKYCLKLQRENGLQNYVCEFCNSIFSRKDSLKRHKKKCAKHLEKSEKDVIISEQKLIIAQMEKSIAEKDIQIEKLQEVINKIAMKPRTVNHNQILNLQPVTQESLQEHSQYFQLEHFKKGLDGVAEYALEHPLRSSVICNDQNRKNFTWKDGDHGDVIINDTKMYHLTHKLCDSIQERSTVLLTEAIREITEECNRKIEEYTQSGQDYLAEVHRSRMLKVIETYDKYSKNIQTLGSGEISDAISEFSNIMAMKIQKYKNPFI